MCLGHPFGESTVRRKRKLDEGNDETETDDLSAVANETSDKDYSCRSDDDDKDIQFGDPTTLNEFSLNEYFEPYRNEAVVGTSENENKKLDSKGNSLN